MWRVRIIYCYARVCGDFVSHRCNFSAPLFFSHAAGRGRGRGRVWNILCVSLLFTPLHFLQREDLRTSALGDSGGKTPDTVRTISCGYPASPSASPPPALITALNFPSPPLRCFTDQMYKCTAGEKRWGEQGERGKGSKRTLRGRTLKTHLEIAFLSSSLYLFLPSHVIRNATCIPHLPKVAQTSLCFIPPLLAIV